MAIAMHGKVKLALCVVLGLCCIVFAVVGAWQFGRLTLVKPTSPAAPTTPTYNELETIWVGESASSFTYTLGTLWADQAGLITPEERRATGRSVRYNINAYLEIDRALPATRYREEQVPNCAIKLVIADMVDKRRITVEEMPFDLMPAAHDTWQSSPYMPPRVKQTLALLRSVESHHGPDASTVVAPVTQPRGHSGAAALAVSLVTLILLVFLLVAVPSEGPHAPPPAEG